MKSAWLAFSLPLLVLGTVSFRSPERVVAAPAANAEEPDRSPTDVVVTADGRFAVTANHTANTATLLDLTRGVVINELKVGEKPFAVALTPDGKRALVTNCWGNSLTVLNVTAGGLTPAKTLPMGDEPRGIVVSRDGKRAFVALAGEESVAVVDLKGLRVEKQLPAGLEPWHVALTPDGTRLAVGNTRGRTVTVLNVATGKPLHTVKVLGRNLRHLAVSHDAQWAYVANISERGLGVTRDNIDRGWVVGNRLARVPLQASGPREAITLDTRGEAVGDVDGVALSPDGQTLALTAGGSHELLLFGQPSKLPFVAYGGPGDHIDPTLLADCQRFRRIPLGGRPLGVRFTPDGKRVVIANYLLNAVQIVDTARGTISATISLGAPSQPSLARQGEALFQDARRSFNQWYSCNTCHTEGHSNGGNFDTLNDGGLGKPKKTLSLRGVAQTAPYTWHGWQSDLRAAIRDSFTKSMQGPTPTEEEVSAVEAYLKTLDWRPNPHRGPGGALTAAARRGEKVFQEKGCATCHSGPNFTNSAVVTVGLEEEGDVYKGFNPPSLRGVYGRAPYLHDSRARTLEEVLTEYHRPSQLSGSKDCTPEELSALIAYLRSL